jgi:hypothetical protein
MCLCLSFLPVGTLARQRPADHAFFLLVDRAGMNIRAEGSYNVMVEALRFIAELLSDREYARSPVEILDMSEGKSQWVGTPRTIIADEKKVLEVISIKTNMCADLERGFEALETKIKNMERRSVQNIHILAFSPLIHTGAPCPEPDIKLPQIPPVNFDFAEALMSSSKIKTILFFNINPRQMRVWGVEGIFKPLVAWDDQGPENRFHLFDEAASLVNLQTEVRGLFR